MNVIKEYECTEARMLFAKFMVSKSPMMHGGSNFSLSSYNNILPGCLEI